MSLCAVAGATTNPFLRKARTTVLFFSTGQVVELLGVPTHRIEYLLRDRKLRPAKGPTGAFHWTESEVRAAAGMLGVALSDVESRLRASGEVAP